MTLHSFKRKISAVVEVVKLICYSCLAVILGIVAYEVIHQRVRFESDARRFSALIGRTEQTVANFKEATDVWKEASKKQATQTTAVLGETKATFAKVRSIASHLDVQLSMLLTASSLAINHQDQSLLLTQENLRETLTGLTASNQKFQEDLAAANKILSDPSIPKSLENLAAATGNANKSTENLAGITQDGKDVADYYKKKLTTPQGFAKTLFQFILDAGSKARILFGGGA